MAANEQPAEKSISSEEKIARILAMSVIRRMKGQSDKVLFLRAGGFSAIEVAAMLGITPNQVAVTEYQSRRQKSGRTKKTLDR